MQDLLLTTILILSTLLQLSAGEPACIKETQKLSMHANILIWVCITTLKASFHGNKIFKSTGSCLPQEKVRNFITKHFNCQG